jgi:hypothetical protein
MNKLLGYLSNGYGQLLSVVNNYVTVKKKGMLQHTAAEHVAT